MNLELEACRKCPVQCRLEDRSKEIVNKVKVNSLNHKQVRELVSTMILVARAVPCPQTEIGRLREETFGLVDERLLEANTRFKYIPTPKRKPKSVKPRE